MLSYIEGCFTSCSDIFAAFPDVIQEDLCSPVNLLPGWVSHTEAGLNDRNIINSLDAAHVFRDPVKRKNGDAALVLRNFDHGSRKRSSCCYSLYHAVLFENVGHKPVFAVGLFANFIFNPIIVDLARKWGEGEKKGFTKIVIRQIFVIFAIYYGWA